MRKLCGYIEDGMDGGVLKWIWKEWNVIYIEMFKGYLEGIIGLERVVCVREWEKFSVWFGFEKG